MPIYTGKHFIPPCSLFYETRINHPDMQLSERERLSLSLSFWQWLVSVRRRMLTESFEPEWRWFSFSLCFKGFLQFPLCHTNVFVFTGSPPSVLGWSVSQCRRLSNVITDGRWQLFYSQSCFVTITKGETSQTAWKTFQNTLQCGFKKDALHWYIPSTWTCSATVVVNRFTRLTSVVLYYKRRQPKYKQCGHTTQFLLDLFSLVVKCTLQL